MAPRKPAAATAASVDLSQVSPELIAAILAAQGQAEPKAPKVEVVEYLEVEFRVNKATPGAVHYDEFQGGKKVGTSNPECIMGSAYLRNLAVSKLGLKKGQPIKVTIEGA